MTGLGFPPARTTNSGALGVAGVGDGFGPRGSEAWIAVIPEPGTSLLVVTGLLGRALRADSLEAHSRQ
jgi:hypothetical protein